VELVGSVRTVIFAITSQSQFNARSIVAFELVSVAVSWSRSCWSRFMSHMHIHDDIVQEIVPTHYHIYRTSRKVALWFLQISQEQAQAYTFIQHFYEK